MQKLTIGISIFPPSSGQSVWSNGAHQNCFFLALLFIEAGHSVVLINGATVDHPDPAGLPPRVRGIPFARMAEVVDSLDVIIEAGAQLSGEDIAKVTARGGVAIAFRFGSNAAIDIERAVNGKPAGSIINSAKFTEVWTTSQHAPMCGQWWELLHRCPVRVLPHIWDPCFVNEACEPLWNVGLTPGYVPGRAKKRLVQFEPSINTIKTCHYPALIMEAAFRKRPELIEQAMITNSVHLRNHLSFETFVGALDIAKPPPGGGMPIMSFEARYNTPWFMSAHGDVVVSHQWVTVPNYSHYDLLWLRYPLVHNVPALRDAGVGYYYEGFNAIDGGDALIRAMTEHDARREEYNDAADLFLDGVMALAPENVKAHNDALLELVAKAAA